MSYKNVLSYAGKPQIMVAPVNTTGSTFASDVINMANYSHMTIIVSQGAWAGGSSTLTVEYCDDNTPTTDTAMAFNYRTAVTGAGATDLMGALTAATSAGITLDTANTTTIIELDAAELEAAGAGNNRVRVKGTSPGANDDYICVIGIPTGARFSEITAID